MWRLLLNTRSRRIVPGAKVHLSLTHKHLQILGVQTDIKDTNVYYSRHKAVPLNAMKTSGGVYVQILSILTSEPNGSAQSHDAPKLSMEPHERGAGWAPALVWTFWRGKRSLPSAGNRSTIPRMSRSKPSNYSAWAIPARLRAVISLIPFPYQ